MPSGVVGSSDRSSALSELLDNIWRPKHSEGNHTHTKTAKEEKTIHAQLETCDGGFLLMCEIFGRMFNIALFFFLNGD